jgi:phosphoribulokinase
VIPRPILLGIAGDSGAGKTTLTRGLVRILGEERVSHVPADHYHRYDRRQRAERGLTPLDPSCNHLDILEQHLLHLRAGAPIMRPVYRHRDGVFGPAEYVRPAQFTVVEGLLAFHSAAMRDAFDIRVFLDPPEELRRRWKVQRDCSRRGYTTDEVLEELDRCESDSETFIRPQRRHADIVVAFLPGEGGDVEHLDAMVALRPGLTHPDLAPVIEGRSDRIALAATGSETSLWISGAISPDCSAEIQEAVWERMHFASHLRTERLGEYTVGTVLHHSGPLAIAQLLVLYQLAIARAAVAVGAEDARADRRLGDPIGPTGPDSAEQPGVGGAATGAR